METYSTIEIIKELKQKELTYFNLSDFSRLFSMGNKNTLYKKIQRLENNGIIKKLIKGKYLFTLNSTNDFITANFLYSPSYISLESALSFYGIITGFSYKITSLTTKKTRLFEIENKEFSFGHIDSKLFWGYEKTADFLIAEKEKAILDYIYYHSKGLRLFDRDEFDWSEINKKKLTEYGKKFNSKKILSIIKKII